MWPYWYRAGAGLLWRCLDASLRLALDGNGVDCVTSIDYSTVARRPVLILTA